MIFVQKWAVFATWTCRESIFSDIVKFQQKTSGFLTFEHLQIFQLSLIFAPEIKSDFDYRF